MSFENASNPQSVFLNKYIEKMQTALTNMLNNSIMLETNLAIANDKLAEVDNIAKQKQEAVSSNEAALNDAKRNVDKLANELGEMNIRVAQYHDEINRKDVNIKQLNHELQQSNENITVLNKKMVELNNLNEMLISKIGMLETELNSVYSASVPEKSTTKRKKEVVVPQDDF